MLERLPRAWRNAALSVLGVLVLWFAWSIRAVLNPLLAGYLLAYILHPIVLRIQGRRLTRRGAVNATFAVGGLLFLLVSVAVVLQARSLVVDVVSNVEVRERVGERWGAVRTGLSDFGVDPKWVPDKAHLKEWLGEMGDEVVALIESDTETARDAAVGAAQVGAGAWRALRRLFGALFGIGGLIVLVPLYTYYMLFELHRLHGFVRRYLPHRERERLSRIGGQIGEVLANFFRGRLLVCFLKGLLLTVLLFVADVPYAFLLGMGSGFLSLIPVFGPAIGFVLAFLLAALEHSFVGALVRTGLAFGVAEVVEGYVLIPKILGDSLGLHPVVVLFALLAGGASLGLFGVLVALPLTASIVILFKELVLPALERFADEDDDESPILRPGED